MKLESVPLLCAFCSVWSIPLVHCHGRSLERAFHNCVRVSRGSAGFRQTGIPEGYFSLGGFRPASFLLLRITCGRNGSQCCASMCKRSPLRSSMKGPGGREGLAFGLSCRLSTTCDHDLRSGGKFKPAPELRDAHHIPFARPWLAFDTSESDWPLVLG